MAYKPKTKPKPKPKPKPNKTGFVPTAVGPAPWQKTYGLCLSGMELIDDLKAVVGQVEDRWGIGRLRMLVPAELREKFDRQRYLTNQAIWHGDLEQVRMHTKKMILAYRKLDEVAQASGASRKPVEQWEAVLASGVVLTLVRTSEDAINVKKDGRKMVVWTMEEIGKVVEDQTAILLAKQFFDGAEVIDVERTIKDPLDSFVTSLAGLDDEVSNIPMLNPLMG
jgi:hypothetical protein